MSKNNMPATSSPSPISDQVLSALHEAALSIAGNLALDKVLRQIVESAMGLVGAEYGALGVPNVHGQLEAFVYSGMDKEVSENIPHMPKGLGLLGAIIKEKKPVRLDNMADDPRSSGFPEGHPPMNSFLGVPIFAGEEVLGNLYLTNKLEADAFSEADQQLVEMFAAHAAVAIQNARLYEEVRHLAVVSERVRIGMDLHDGVIQNIYAVGLTLEAVKMLLPEAEKDAGDLVDKAIDELNGAIRDIRSFILDLRPRRFEGDLTRGLARLIREFQANTMIPVTQQIDESILVSLSPAIARAIFLTTQEAFANIARHAQASQATLTIEKITTDTISVTVSDDGCGFDADEQMDIIVGHGLANMQRRAETLKGTFKLKTDKEKGTTIYLQFPITI